MAIELKASWRRWFNRLKVRATRLETEPGKAELTADQALRKGRGLVKLRQAWEDVQVLVRLVRCWARGEYRDVPRSTMILVLGALVYFVSPIDAILDQIPFIGLVDDAAILAWVVSEVKVELDAFRAWESRRQNALEVVATEVSAPGF
jgi:uncharacterized membrane protein YkvA (DUF1232 family)